MCSGNPVRMMDDGARPALRHGHLQRLDHQRRAQVRGDGPAHDPAAEHVEHDGQVEEAREGRHVGDVGQPQANRRVGRKAALDQVRCGSCLDNPARGARPAAPTHARNACGAHHARHPLAADRHTSCRQLGVDPRRAVRAAATGVNLFRAGRQVRIGLRASRHWAPTPRVVPARGDTEHTGHRGDAKLRLVRVWR